VQELIEVVSNHYKMLVESGTWKATKVTEICIVALTAEIVVLNEENATKTFLAMNVHYAKEWLIAEENYWMEYLHLVPSPQILVTP
jgi:hypothetical protein